jgi:hypothetical protein
MGGCCQSLTEDQPTWLTNLCGSAIGGLINCAEKIDEQWPYTVYSQYNFMGGCCQSLTEDQPTWLTNLCGSAIDGLINCAEKIDEQWPYTVYSQCNFRQVWGGGGWPTSIFTKLHQWLCLSLNTKEW